MSHYGDYSRGLGISPSKDGSLVIQEKSYDSKFNSRVSGSGISSLRPPQQQQPLVTAPRQVFGTNRINQRDQTTAEIYSFKPPRKTDQSSQAVESEDFYKLTVDYSDRQRLPTIQDQPGEFMTTKTANFH